MTSPVDTSVKFYHSDMPGAPALSASSAGSLISLLDACIKDGFGIKTLTSLVVASGIATATFSGGAGAWQRDAVVLIAGVTGGLTALNGEQKVLTATATTVTFATAAANGTATGTITMKMAPLGFTKEFTGTNLAVYKSGDVASTGMFLRVDDTDALFARVRMFESMSDVNTGTGPTPTDAAWSGGLYWHKAYSSIGSIPWAIHGDGRAFYLSIATGWPGGSRNKIVNFFGDGVELKSGDAYCCAISGQGTTYSTLEGNMSTTNFTFASSGTYMPRAYTGVGSPVGASRLFAGTSYSYYSGGVSYPALFPNAVDNSLILVELEGWNGTTGNMVRRCIFPGIFHVVQNTLGNFQTGALVDGVGPYAGKHIMAVKGDNPGAPHTNPSYGGVVFFDITGPWR